MKGNKIPKVIETVRKNWNPADFEKSKEEDRK